MAHHKHKPHCRQGRSISDLWRFITYPGDKRLKSSLVQTRVWKNPRRLTAVDWLILISTGWTTFRLGDFFLQKVPKSNGFRTKTSLQREYYVHHTGISSSLDQALGMTWLRPHHNFLSTMTWDAIIMVLLNPSSGNLFCHQSVRIRCEC